MSIIIQSIRKGGENKGRKEGFLFRLLISFTHISVVIIITSLLTPACCAMLVINSSRASSSPCPSSSV